MKPTRMHDSLHRFLCLIAGGTILYASACSLRDIQLNVVSGTLGFVETFTEDAWAALVPPPAVILGRDDE